MGPNAVGTQVVGPAGGQRHKRHVAPETVVVRAAVAPTPATRASRSSRSRIATPERRLRLVRRPIPGRMPHHPD
jgi:hypothetical protein